MESVEQIEHEWAESFQDLWGPTMPLCSEDDMDMIYMATFIHFCQRGRKGEDAAWFDYAEQLDSHIKALNQEWPYDLAGRSRSHSGGACMIYEDLCRIELDVLTLYKSPPATDEKELRRRIQTLLRALEVVTTTTLRNHAPGLKCRRRHRSLAVRKISRPPHLSAALSATVVGKHKS